MGYHHLALATQDINAIHQFYEGIMGFELVKVEIQPVREGGWAKHFFYRMEDDSKFIAFWELHDVPGTEDMETALSRAANVPHAINHISFDADSMDDIARRKAKWLEAGLEVMEIDHNWCHSIYTNDPNGNLVEFCVTTGSFDTTDRDHALASLQGDTPDFSPPPASIDFHHPQDA